MGIPDPHEDDESGNPLDLPDMIESVGHAILAKEHQDDEDAYEHLPRIAKMRSSAPDVELRIEEELVIGSTPGLV